MPLKRGRLFVGAGIGKFLFVVLEQVKKIPCGGLHDTEQLLWSCLQRSEQGDHELIATRKVSNGFSGLAFKDVALEESRLQINGAVRIECVA